MKDKKKSEPKRFCGVFHQKCPEQKEKKVKEGGGKEKTTDVIFCCFVTRIKKGRWGEERTDAVGIQSYLV